MGILLILLVSLILLNIAALRWGHDSTDKIESLEWERRRNWYRNWYR